MERSHRRVAVAGGKPKGYGAIKALLDPTGEAWTLIREGERRYARRRTGNDSSPPPMQKG